MTSARSTKIDLNATPFYHCISRCVRRTFLCGVDKETGVDYSHRKQLIAKRMMQLADIFAIQVCSYAVMSNHYHMVVFVNEKQANSWSDNDVMSLWAKLHPCDASKYAHLEITSDLVAEKICEWRARLADISWFMKCLNETIAKLCNKEDDCKGHFWEARFKSQALLDEAAVIAAMAYVDLNPIRAKEALTPEASEFTSIFERIKALKNSNKNNQKDKFKINDSISAQPHNLMPFFETKPNEKEQFPSINFKLSDYIELVDTTGRIIRDDKRGAIPEMLPPILQRLNLSPRGWMSLVQNIESFFYTGIGHVTALCKFRSQYREHNPRGLSAAKQCYIPSVA